jgi:hypothetical protein
MNMNAQTDTKLTVLILSRFLRQLRSRLYQCIYLGSAAYIAHRETRVLSDVVDMNVFLLFGSQLLVYLLMILVSVFLFTTVLAVVNARSVELSVDAQSSHAYSPAPVTTR